MRRPTILISTVALVLFSSLTAPAAERGFKRREFQKRYREVLQQYSSGEAWAAVDSLMEAEESAVEAGGVAFLQPLRKAELKVIEEVLPRGGVALQPIIALHEQAYLRYREEKRETLIPHAREMIVELIRDYEASVDTEEGRMTASRMMTSLAGHLQEVRVDSAAANLYRRALNLDGVNSAALTGLSFLHEQYGEYSDAVRYLAMLVEIDPGNGAARLRLGVNLVRQGRREEGAEYLRTVLSATNPRWMQSVAYQELARILTDDEDLSGARALLEEGVKSVPDDPNLLIQLAYLSERNGSFSEDPALRLALRRAEDLDLEMSPRYFYSRLPSTTLVTLRRQLERQSKDQLGLLASLLGFDSAPDRSREGVR